MRTQDGNGKGKVTEDRKGKGKGKGKRKGNGEGQGIVKQIPGGDDISLAGCCDYRKKCTRPTRTQRATYSRYI